MQRLRNLSTHLYNFIGSWTFFALVIGCFALSAAWIAFASIYPMAFDEEFHLGLIQIFSTSLLPFGINHTSDMAQYGAATADASYLFHYLLSFPYRIFEALGVPDTNIVILLRLLNIGFVVGALYVFRRAFLAAGVSGAVSNVALLMVTLIPIMPVLAAHINYDNLLLLVIAWCLLSLIKLTQAARSGDPLPLNASLQLAVGVLLGMSIKYAFLPLALSFLIWIIWLLVIAYRRHRQMIRRQLVAYKRQWNSLRPNRRRLTIAGVALSLFFAAHYVTNTLTYGSPIPSCERVFSESECTAYGPWNRNRNYEANKSESFVPLSYVAYMQEEWFPGMSQRLTFAVAGKTNDFQTKLPLPALVNMFVGLSVIGAVCLAVQVVRRRATWLVGLCVLMTVIYAGVLSFQLYGDYVDTAQPVAINGRYLIPLLPLLAVVMIQSIRAVLSFVDRRILVAVSMVALVALIVSGAGVATYVVLSEPHWHWPGYGQDSHAFLQAVFRFVLSYRY